MKASDTVRCLTKREQDAYGAGEKAGIKEVVEWLKEHNSSAHNAIVFIPQREWESKLKEWGLDGGR